MQMKFEVPTRTHIMPMGYEEERVYGPAELLRADNVVIISPEERTKRFNGHYETVCRELNKRVGTSPTTVSCDIFDIYDSIGTIGKAIADHSDDEVYVNLSAGSKITAVAGMIACLTNSGATPYYVQVDNYDEECPQNIIDIIELPEYAVEPPTADQIDILGKLRERGQMTKGELIAFSEKVGLDFLADYEGKEKAKYRRLDRHIVTPLAEREYVDVSRKGRNRVVDITEEGKQTYTAFEHTLNKQTGSQEVDLST